MVTLLLFLHHNQVCVAYLISKCVKASCLGYYVHFICALCGREFRCDGVLHVIGFLCGFLTVCHSAVNAQRVAIGCDHNVRNLAFKQQSVPERICNDSAKLNS